MCGWVCGCDCGCVRIAYQNHIRCLLFAMFFPLRGITDHRRTHLGAVGLDSAQRGKTLVLWLWWQGPLQMELHDVWWCLYCFYVWFKKGGSETIKQFSCNSLCRCFKAHTILTSIMICLWFAGCGGDSFHQSAQKSPSSGCFFKRDFGESSLLKLRNFKTSIRICLCFASCGGDSFHQIAKNPRQAGASSSHMQAL